MKNIIFFTVLSLLCIGCGKSLLYRKHKINLTRLSNEAIMDIMRTKRGSALIYIDSFMAYRPILPPIITYHEKYELLYDDYPVKPALIQIPDSLKSYCAYYQPVPPTTVLNDSLHVMYFSPLLPTKQKNLYYMYTYYFATDFITDSRFVIRDVLKYKIVHGSMKCLGSVNPPENMDIYFFYP